MLYAGVIFLLSSWSSPPNPPAGFTDKHVHAAVYAGLALLVFRALSRGWMRLGAGIALGTTVLTGLYGASDELHQYFVPGRSCDWRDLVADVTGAAVASAIAWWAARAWQRRQRASPGDGTAMPHM